MDTDNDSSEQQSGGIFGSINASLSSSLAATQLGTTSLATATGSQTLASAGSGVASDSSDRYVPPPMVLRPDHDLEENGDDENGTFSRGPVVPETSFNLIVTCAEGIDSTGLHEMVLTCQSLAQQLANDPGMPNVRIGRILVVAPGVERTWSSQSLSRTSKIQWQELTYPENSKVNPVLVKAFHHSGYAADSVVVALKDLFASVYNDEPLPRNTLVIVGYGTESAMGEDANVSGAIGTVRQSYVMGFDAAAFNLEPTHVRGAPPGEWNFQGARGIVKGMLIQRMVFHAMNPENPPQAASVSIPNFASMDDYLQVQRTHTSRGMSRTTVTRFVHETDPTVVDAGVQTAMAELGYEANEEEDAKVDVALVSYKGMVTIVNVAIYE
jgi:5'/3'-nucleotidase SurE